MRRFLIFLFLYFATDCSYSVLGGDVHASLSGQSLGGIQMYYMQWHRTSRYALGDDDIITHSASENCIIEDSFINGEVRRRLNKILDHAFVNDQTLDIRIVLLIQGDDQVDTISCSTNYLIKYQDKVFQDDQNLCSFLRAFATGKGYEELDVPMPLPIAPEVREDY